jgi:predicted ATP-dependent endonuclease of OLD family
MKIDSIKIRNYRLLKNSEINLRDDLSLVIGKNNTGKTSFLSLLENFLLTNERNPFSFDDISLAAQKEFKEVFEQRQYDEGYNFGISLRLYISYGEDDTLSNIKSMMLNLDPDENVVVIAFYYIIDFENLKRLENDYQRFQERFSSDQIKNVLNFLKDNHSNYFQRKIRALENKNEENFKEIESKKSISKILSFKRIKAKRDVVNPDGTSNSSNKTLSRKSSKYYNRITNSENEPESIQDLKRQLMTADVELDKIYKTLFEGVVSKVKKFGGVRSGESVIEIKSTLEERNLLRDNTSVIYRQNGEPLPEDYNGLGYLNLIAIIFEIEVVLADFKKKTSELEEPSDINLFFIEEPEAHTHPQMQYIFINNIRDILEEASGGIDDDVPIDLQTVISTHSSHITAESEFDDVKYFKRDNGKENVVSKNLSSLKEKYEDQTEQYEFLKQYLTLNRAELFFADKAVLIEGDTERILLPAFMKKLDIEEEAEEDVLPLLSQNISIVEVGAYSHIFTHFINFLDIKSLIITDIDTIDADKKACRVECDDTENYSNDAISFYLNEPQLDAIKDSDIEERCLAKQNGKWQVDKDGDLLLAFQKKEKSYFARSFEDAFIHLNKDFISGKKDLFRGLKKRDLFENGNDAYYLSENCIKKKTHFAFDILYHSDGKYSNWEIPGYIKEGLLWLKRKS